MYNPTPEAQMPKTNPKIASFYVIILFIKIIRTEGRE